MNLFKSILLAGGTIVMGCGLCAGIAHATPITSNTFDATATSANPSTLGAGDTVSTNGVTFSGGSNSSSAAFGADQSYLDIPGAITVSFASPVSGFGFDFTTNNVNLIVSAYSATNVLLETDTFDVSGLPTAQGYPTGYAGITGLTGASSAVVTTSLGSNSVYIGTVTYATAVPEPATLTLFGASLVGLWMVRRRRA